MAKKTQKNYNAIIDAMQLGVWYKATDFKGIVQVKESRVKELLAELVELGKIESAGSTKDKRYKKFEACLREWTNMDRSEQLNEGVGKKL